MIRSFRSRSLAALWHRGDVSGIRPDLLERVRLRLDALNAAHQPAAMNIPGFNFHRLRGKPIRYAVAVNGPWRITFEWDDGHPVRVDLE
jgi:proteic killer suppression protein